MYYECPKVYRRKYIYIDKSTDILRKKLWTECYNVKGLISLCKAHNFSVNVIWKWCNNLSRTLELQNFLNIANALKWDLSDNINFQFVNPYLSTRKLTNRIINLGFHSPRDFWQYFHIATEPEFFEALGRLSKNYLTYGRGRIPIFARILKCLTEEEQRYLRGNDNAYIPGYNKMYKYDGEKVYQ